jgi:hypothetical protein
MILGKSNRPKGKFLGGGFITVASSSDSGEKYRITVTRLPEGECSNAKTWSGVFTIDSAVCFRSLHSKAYVT